MTSTAEDESSYYGSITAVDGGLDGLATHRDFSVDRRRKAWPLGATISNAACLLMIALISVVIAWHHVTRNFVKSSAVRVFREQYVPILIRGDSNSHLN